MYSKILSCTISSTVLVVLLFWTLQTALGAERPTNVLLIMADDLRDFGGAFKKDVVKIPNLDRLRERGTTFERAYVQYPVCNPSRSSMMTGLRAEQTGIVGNDTPLREKLPDIVTMPQLFKDHGWQSQDSDPEEHHDVSDKNPDVVTELTTQLKAVISK